MATGQVVSAGRYEPEPNPSDDRIATTAMTNHSNPEIDRRASVQDTPLDGVLQPATGRWRSIEAHAWLVVRSGHGLATEVTSLGPTQSGTVEVHDDLERTSMRLDIDLEQLANACVTCRTSRLERTTTLTVESTHVGPVTDNRWALAGRLSSSAGDTLVDSELEVRDVNRRSSHDEEARFVVRTEVSVAALGLCDTHPLGHSGIDDHAELVTHLLMRRDATA